MHLFHPKKPTWAFNYTLKKSTYLVGIGFFIFVPYSSIFYRFANKNINLCRENVSIINYANETSQHKYYNDFVLY